MYRNRPRHLSDVLVLARRWGSRAHIVHGGRRLSFDQIWSAVAHKAEALRAVGTMPGARVVLFGWNSPEWIVNFWACITIGAVPVLANAWWSADEFTYALDLLAPELVLADTAHEPPRFTSATPAGEWGCKFDIAEPPQACITVDNRTENDAAVIIFTSGTAGSPKAVELSHRALIANLQMVLHMTHRLPHEVDDASGEVVLHTGPLFHVGGPQMLMRSIAVGNTIVVPTGRFDPAEALRLIEEHRITRWAAVPTMLVRLLDDPDLAWRDVSTLRSVTIGGAPIHAELLERVRRLLPSVLAGVPTGYGLTENCGQATAAAGRDTLRHPGTAGRPVPLTELTFGPSSEANDGEILVRSPTQMTRYIGTDESPIDADGWLHTGDLGHLDDRGLLWITGRSKDLIIRGGENIAPAAVERAIAAVPGVVEVAVIGVAHPELGEEVCAFVVIDAPHTQQSLQAAIVGTVASFAVPSVWRLLTVPLPTNQTGKIDKRSLAESIRGAR